MTHSDTLDASAPFRVEGGHGGSASPVLTGRAVVVAWVISVCLHGVMFFGMLSLVFPFSSAPAAVEPTVVHADIVDSPDQSLFNSNLPRKFPLPIPEPAHTEQRITPKQFTDFSALTMTKKPDLAIIGIGAGGGGDITSYGLSVGGGPGPEFFGLGQSARGARKIVYVVDRSGSMADTFVYVQQELRRSINALRRSQKFHVIFFASDRLVENPPGRLVSAIPAQKEAFFEFLSTVSPGGGTKPAPAMRRALALRPDVVYLLSDGIDFAPGLLRSLDEWNADRHVRIYTIAYLDQTGRELLELIAREHHGEFKFVSEDDLP